MKREIVTYIASIAAIILGIVMFGLVGQSDYEQELRDLQVYCDNVQGGYWPDYNHNAKEVCK